MTLVNPPRGAGPSVGGLVDVVEGFGCAVPAGRHSCSWSKHHGQSLRPSGLWAILCSAETLLLRRRDGQRELFRRVNNFLRVTLVTEGITRPSAVWRSFRTLMFNELSGQLVPAADAYS